MKNNILSFIVGLMCVFIIGSVTHELSHIKSPAVKVVIQKEVMSIRELQTFLKATGVKRYDPGKIDGKLGAKDKGTRKAWDNYICDRHYKESTHN